MNSVLSTTDSYAVSSRRTLAGALAVALFGALGLGVLRGLPSAVLWLAFSALSGAVVLFWETLRLVLDPLAPGDAHEDDEESATRGLSARKRSALRALKELEFERSLGRISEEDFQGLSTQYRTEARAAMQALDDDLGTWRSEAAALLERAEAAPETTATETAPETTPEAAPKTVAAETAATEAVTRACPKCSTVNDTDAVFCKKCGTRMVPEGDEAAPATEVQDA